MDKPTPCPNGPGAPRNAADDTIDTLAELVLAAYPPERLARIRSRSEHTWNSAHADTAYDDRISYVMPAMEDPPATQHIGVPGDATDVQREMIYQLKAMVDWSCVDGEYYPGFMSGLEQVTIPSMFGCVKENISQSNHIKPILRSPSDVWSLPPAEIREGAVCHYFLNRMAYKYRRLGGRIPVYMTDVQGPFSCAAQIWGIQDFLLALDEHPDEAHRLLSLCTGAIIQFFHAMYGVTDGTLIPIHCHPMVWVPRDCGVAVSDDFFAVVGPRTVREFSMPYLEKIGEAFGGVTAHTCGNMNHLPATLNEMKTLRALNFGATETDLFKYAGECDPRITILAHKTPDCCFGLPRLNDIEHLRLCARTQRETGVKVFCTMPCGVAHRASPENRKLWADAARLQP